MRRLRQLEEENRRLKGMVAVQALAIRALKEPEFRGRVMHEWAYGCGARLQFIEPGKPIQNAFVESFNSSLRYRLGDRRGIRGGMRD